ncbi:anti-sigma factor domain-containing protein [Pseudanabaena sp. PCC 6802]|uniref:anti-sigma factor n=1 Tax=Pseudanabaena sp. PCC 6802 TaxID=118173 RepID=UPI000348EEFF|nr:anti-sigma factor [Pseudanabaena sp. PCC 6802]
MVDREQFEAWEELLAGYVLGDLSPEEVEEVNQLLISHPELFAEVNSLQETLALIPMSLPESSPSAGLRSRLLAQIDEQPQNQFRLELARNAIALPPSQRQIWAPLSRWLAILSGVAATIAVALGLDSYRLRQELASARSDASQYRALVAMLRQPDNRLLALKGMGATPTASGSITITPSSQTATIAIQNLTPLPQGKVYRLWAIVDGKKVECAEFVPDSQGKVWLQVPLDRFLSKTGTVAITVEPAQRNPQSTGEMVMQGGSTI